MCRNKELRCKFGKAGVENRIEIVSRATIIYKVSEVAKLSLASMHLVSDK